MQSDELKSAVEISGSAWKVSPYYEDAEKWMHVFWSDRSVFVPFFQHLDLTSVIELACGHGRHAEQIAARAGKLLMMDIHEENIRISRQRLAKFPHVMAMTNNGFDFQPVADASVTSIFCYDAMVHFEPELVDSYLRDTVRVLRPGGRAFFHHSNYTGSRDQHYAHNPAQRNVMGQGEFQLLALTHGLVVLRSQVIPWANIPAIDCLTLVEKPAV